MAYARFSPNGRLLIEEQSGDDWLFELPWPEEDRRKVADRMRRGTATNALTSDRVRRRVSGSTCACGRVLASDVGEGAALAERCVICGGYVRRRRRMPER